MGKKGLGDGRTLKEMLNGIIPGEENSPVFDRRLTTSTVIPPNIAWSNETGEFGETGDYLSSGRHISNHRTVSSSTSSHRRATSEQPNSQPPSHRKLNFSMEPEINKWRRYRPPDDS